MGCLCQGLHIFMQLILGIQNRICACRWHLVCYLPRPAFACFVLLKAASSCEGFLVSVLPAAYESSGALPPCTHFLRVCAALCLWVRWHACAFGPVCFLVSTCALNSPRF